MEYEVIKELKPHRKPIQYYVVRTVDKEFPGGGVRVRLNAREV